MAKKYFITDERMLQLAEWAVEKKLAVTAGDFYTKIGFSKNNIGHVHNKTTGFTKEQILEACKLTGANANWLFGLEKNMLRVDHQFTVMDKLREIVILVENELNEKLPHSLPNSTQKKKSQQKS